MLIVPQHSGHTIFSRHIEDPAREFFVAWDAPAYVNILRFEAGRRWARVLAETEEGALEVARYHYFSGDNFVLLPGRPNSPTGGYGAALAEPAQMEQCPC